MRPSRLAALSLALAACSPDVEQNALQPVTFARFDPRDASVLPLPNDIILALGAPADSSDQTKLFIKYLQTINGFPPSATPATCLFGTLTPDGAKIGVPETGLALQEDTLVDDSASRDSGTANLIIFDVGKPGPIDIEHSYDKTTGKLSVSRKADANGVHPAWEAGHQYIAQLRAGSIGKNGKKRGVWDAAGNPIVPEVPFFLLVQDRPLIDVKNNNKSTVDGLDDASAAGLELLRTNYTPAFLVTDAYIPHKELALMWTFKVTGNPLSGLDPSTNTIPFPNDIVRTPATATAPAHVNIPIDPTQPAPLQTLTAGLNTLDGFSTTADITATTTSAIDPAFVTNDTVKLFQVGATGLTPVTNVTVGVPGETAGLPGVDLGAKTIAIRPTRPLSEATTYIAVITTGVKNANDKLQLLPSPAQALVLAKVALVDGAGKSVVPGIDDKSAAAGEALRQAMAPVVALLGTKGITSDQIALVWTFTTQSIQAPAAQLRALPFNVPGFGALPTGAHCSVGPKSVLDCGGTTQLDAAHAVGANGYDPAVTPSSHIKDTIVGTFATISLLSPTYGAFDPAAAHREDLNFTLYRPKGAGPSRVVIFHHGLAGSRNAATAVADAFAAKGFATVAIDSALEGDRAHCNGDNECASGSSCVSASTALGPTVLLGKCVTAGCDPMKAVDAQGLACESELAGALLKRESGPLSRPVASGNGFLSANLFQIRDVIRQDLIDYSQLIRVLEANAVSFGLDLSPNVNGAEVVYVGQSMGAIRGAVIAATESRIGKTVLNVGGASLVDIFVNSPNFQAAVSGILAANGLDKTTNPAGFAQFINTAKWILDPADPMSFAQSLTHSQLALPDLVASAVLGHAVNVPTKGVLMQEAVDDQVVPNLTTTAYANLIGVTPTTYFSTGSTTLPINRHPFFTIWNSSSSTDEATVTTAAQLEAANFLAAP